MPKIVEFDDDRDSVGADAPSGDPETLLLRKQEVGPINGARERLSTVFREAIVLRELEGLSYTEIVTVTDVPIGTVAKRLKVRTQRVPGRVSTWSGGLNLACNSGRFRILALTNCGRLPRYRAVVIASMRNVVSDCSGSSGFVLKPTSSASRILGETTQTGAAEKKYRLVLFGIQASHRLTLFAWRDRFVTHRAIAMV